MAIVPLYCSALSLTRSAQAERDNESCFFFSESVRDDDCTSSVGGFVSLLAFHLSRLFDDFNEVRSGPRVTDADRNADRVVSLLAGRPTRRRSVRGLPFDDISSQQLSVLQLYGR
ncbi:hypothetical protein EVAR_44549_1 [Eumeta japonica]|uniref:Uncharacterized protein n=1 Tax=Eumeta variegata TaxID=151549 RepID=A0A4C1X9P4_EUMVA|nr:hypothetical protein EVAR_44549_1 [Eumeta japonica]